MLKVKDNFKKVLKSKETLSQEREKPQDTCIPKKIPRETPTKEPTERKNEKNEMKKLISRSAVLGDPNMRISGTRLNLLYQIKAAKLKQI